MAFVLTSISGNLISAASAGYAPTNSADVSAIASGYQVVSSTSTELYAGTSFLTGVNGAPVSASRAGNAANAGMANSAYYDGTGRLISSLPDSAAVSSIASSYAESAASGKLDSSASSSFYTVDNPSGFITGVDLSEYATTGYVDSAVSGKADSSALSSYALSSDVSGVIDTVSTNSASWGGGATGDYVEKSAMEVAIGSGNTVSATAFAQGADNVVSGASVAFGVNNVATGSSMAAGDACSSMSKALAVGESSTAWSNALAVGYRDNANNRGLAVGDRCSASMNALAFGYCAIAYANSVAAGEFCYTKNTAVAFGKYNLHVDGDTSTGESAAFVIGDGEYGAHHDLMLVTKDGEITMYSSTADTVGTGIMSSIRAISAAATGGGVDSATVSAIASAYVESGVSSKLDTTAQVVTSIESSDYQYEGSWVTGVKGINGNFLAALYRVDGEELASQGDISGVIDTVSSNSATWGQGGVDSATVSAIASSYAESAVSSKLDESATAGFYSTSNPSSFVDRAYVDSAVSGKMDSSAMTSYALSADVSGTVDLVSTQSANWGGSALALSAGPGVKLEKVGNTLVAGLDETVLWSGACLTQGGAAATLSEAASNFDKIAVYAVPNPGTSSNYPQIFTYDGSCTIGAYMCPFMNSSLKGMFSYGRWSITNGTSFNLTDAAQTDTYPTLGFDNSYGGVIKVVGINRTAEA